MRWTLVIPCAVLGALLVAAAQDRPESIVASTALRMDLDQLVDASALVLEGRVVSATPVVAPDGLVHTDYQLAVDRTFLGEDLPVRTVRLPGGLLPSGRGTLVPGMPRLAVGEDVFLMLSAPSQLGSCVVCGLSQGRYRVVADGRGGKLAVSAIAGPLVDGATGELLQSQGVAVLDYPELVARLESASAAKRSRLSYPDRGEGR